MRLRALTRADAPRIAALCNDAEIARMTSRLPHPYDVSEAERFLDALLSAETGREADPARRALGAEVAWGVEVEWEGAARLAGLAGWSAADGGAAGDVGYWLGRPFWGLGVATAAAAALAREAFSDPRLHELRACVFQDNPASARVLEKAGFRYVGDCEGWSVARGRADPTWLYRLGRGAWEERA